MSWWQAWSSKTDPMLTFYGEERVELSGKVLTNWLFKTINFLHYELGAFPGEALGFELPVHWRGIIWHLAAQSLDLDAGPWSAASPDWQEQASALVTDHPDLAQRAADAGLSVYVVALSALAWRYPTELPPGCEDANANVLSQADQLLVGTGELKLEIPLDAADLSSLLQPINPDIQGGALALYPANSASAAGEDSKAKSLSNLVDQGAGQRVLLEVDADKVSLVQLSGWCQWFWARGSSVVVNAQGAGKSTQIARAEGCDYSFGLR